MLQLKKVHSLKMGLKFKVLKPYSPVPNNIPPSPSSLVFGFFVGTPPHLLIFQILYFVLQIFQRLLKRIALFAKL